MKKHLFFLITVLTLNLFSYYDENMIQMINEVDTKGVEILLKQSKLTLEEKIKLLATASSSITNCTLEQKELKTKTYDAAPGERFGVVVASIASFGVIMSPLLFFIASPAAGLSSAIATVAIFSPGYWHVYYAQKKRASAVKDKQKEYQQKINDAQDIKKLILLAR